MDIQFLEDGLEVAFDRVVGDEQAAGYLLVGVPLGQQLQYFFRAPGQGFQFVRGWPARFPPQDGGIEQFEY